MKTIIFNKYIEQDNITKLVPIANAPIANAEVRVFLWHHTFNRQSLIKIAETNYPNITKKIETALCDKRFIEKLSIQMLIHQVFGALTELSHYPTGRPFLSTNEYEISISHTKNVYALSVSSQRHGIDIELFNKKTIDVAKTYVNECEKKWLCKNEQNKINQHTALWCIKEAVYKLYDQPGLSFKSDIIACPKDIHTYHINLPLLNKKCSVHLQFYEAFACAIATE